MLYWGLVIAAIVGSLVFAVAKSESFLRRWILSLCTLLGILATVAGARASYEQLQELARQHEEAVRLEKRRAAFEFCDRLHELPYQDAHIALSAIAPALDDNAIAEALSWLKEGSNEVKGKALLDILNYFENLAVAVQEDFVDEGVVCNLLRGPALETFEDARALIHHKRKTDEYSHVHYEDLYSRWQTGCPTTRHEAAD